MKALRPSPHKQSKGAEEAHKFRVHCSFCMLKKTVTVLRLTWVSIKIHPQVERKWEKKADNPFLCTGRLRE